MLSNPPSLVEHAAAKKFDQFRTTDLVRKFAPLFPRHYVVRGIKNQAFSLEERNDFFLDIIIN